MADTDKDFPVEAHEIDPAHVSELKKYFEDTGLTSTCQLRCGPGGYALVSRYKEIGSAIYNMEVRPDDIFVVTFPKSGTTWTQDLVWLISNNYDFEKAVEISLFERFPFLDIPMLLTSVEMPEDAELRKFIENTPKPTVESVFQMPSPRFIKSHMPLSLLPPKLLDTCKVVYVARDPRDVAVSYFHHERMLKTNKESNDFKTFWNFFVRDLLIYTPYFTHVKEAWAVRDHPNMLFLFYEELSMDLAACACRVAKFLGKDIPDEQLQKLCDHLNIRNFKNNKSVNLEDMKQLGFFNTKENFIRKGKVGGWKEYFDEEMTEQAERWIEENLRDTDFRFPE